MASILWEVCGKLDIFSGWKILKFKQCSKGIIYLLKLTDLYAVLVEDDNENVIYTYSSFDRYTATIKYNDNKEKLLRGEPIDYD